MDNDTYQDFLIGALTNIRDEDAEKVLPAFVPYVKDLFKIMDYLNKKNHNNKS